MIDVYQATTQMTDESGQSYPFTPNTLLDNALGPRGYYGAFTANMHSDHASTFESDQLLASATARRVPLVTARQMLGWIDGRNASSFGVPSWSGSTLSFSVDAGPGADGLTGMLPTAGPNGRVLSSLSRSGSSIGVTRTTIKGIEYAMFPVIDGSYQATYGAAAGVAAFTGPRPQRAGAASAFAARDTRPPTVRAVRVLPLPDGTATVTWKTGERSDSRVRFGTRRGRLT
jgi:hypothetical protein